MDWQRYQLDVYHRSTASKLKFKAGALQSKHDIE